jgi:ATP-binding cassette, subfamily B, bacterial
MVENRDIELNEIEVTLLGELLRGENQNYADVASRLELDAEELSESVARYVISVEYSDDLMDMLRIFGLTVEQFVEAVVQLSRLGGYAGLLDRVNEKTKNIPEVALAFSNRGHTGSLEDEISPNRAKASLAEYLSSVRMWPRRALSKIKSILFIDKLLIILYVFILIIKGLLTKVAFGLSKWPHPGARRPTKWDKLRGIAPELGAIARRGRNVWRLFPWRQRQSLFGALAVTSLASAANTSIWLFLRGLINSVDPALHPGTTTAVLTQVAVFYLAVIAVAYLIRESMNMLRHYLVEEACTRIDKNIYVRVVAHLMKVDLAVLTQDHIGAVYGRIHRSVEGPVRFLRLSFLEFVPALFTGAFALAATVSRQPTIALAMLGVAPLSLALSIWQIVTQKVARLDLLRTRDRMDGTVVEQLGGIDYVRAAHTHKQEVRRVAKAAERRRAKELRHHFQMSLFGSGKAVNEGFFHLLVLAFAVYLLVHERLQAGDVLMFSGLFLYVMAPLKEFRRFVDEAHESSLRIGDLLGLLAVPVDRSFKAPADAATPRLALGEPLFAAEGLEVEFGTAAGPKRALNGLSVVIRHGETIGVAGRSGSGKTTWLRTLMRLVHPCGGSASLGGIPLERVSRQAIGELIGYVGQNPFVFAGTVAENIAYGSKGVTAESIHLAAKMASIHDEIMVMPGGYRSRVAERGQNLSFGQRQRIALARIFLKNPSILILDEGTSALDNTSELLVQNAIYKARADRTVIFVAHRLTTLRDADRILVFEDGRIVETGIYAELVRRGGVFAELVRSAEGHEPPSNRIDVLPTPAETALKMSVR